MWLISWCIFLMFMLFCIFFIIFYSHMKDAWNIIWINRICFQVETSTTVILTLYYTYSYIQIPNKSRISKLSLSYKVTRVCLLCNHKYHILFISQIVNKNKNMSNKLITTFLGQKYVLPYFSYYKNIWFIKIYNSILKRKSLKV